MAVYLGVMTNEIIAKYEARALEVSHSLSEIARMAKVAQSTLTGWRKGRKPQGETLRKLDRVLAHFEAERAQ